MKKKHLLILSFFVLHSINAQEFNQNIDKDSLFQVFIKNVHPTKVRELKKAYKKGNKAEKEFFLTILSFPKSSKSKQIDNLKTNQINIDNLVNQFSKMVPDSIIVNIEFNQKNVVLSMDESIDLHIYSKQKNKHNGIELDFKERHLSYDSPVLLAQIKRIGWNSSTISEIKKLLDKANCISIKNGKKNTVGFARSGMGKYSYLLFKNDLTAEEQEEFNDGCYYIHYKENIVLEFGGGAVGQQCFEKE